MFKNIIFIAATASALTLSALSASATTVTTNSGSYVGTVSGSNDPFPNPLVYNAGNFNISSAALFKCDDIEATVASDTTRPRISSCPKTESGKTDYSYLDDFSFTFDYFKIDDDKAEPIGGTWSFASNDSQPLSPHYMVLKAGNGYSIYDILGLTTGNWSTVEHLDSKKISHISFYNSKPDVPPVPIPAAGWMLIAGLGGLGAMRRFRKS